MAFKQKQDYYGLGQIEGLVLVSTTENKSEDVVEAQASNGFVCAVEGFGIKSAPACEFIVKSDVNLNDITFGDITTISGSNFCLASLEVNTQAGSAPTVTASGTQVENTIIPGSCKATLPSITIGGLHHAQTFGAFTLSGAGAHLQQSTWSAQCEVSTAEKDGQILAHDIVGGTVTINGTIQVSDQSYPVPTLSVATGWKITSPVTETNPDSNFPTYTFTLTKYLTADA